VNAQRYNLALTADRALLFDTAPAALMEKTGFHFKMRTQGIPDINFPDKYGDLDWPTQNKVFKYIQNNFEKMSSDTILDTKDILFDSPLDSPSGSGIDSSAVGGA
jgi:hypothetical protein